MLPRRLCYAFKSPGDALVETSMLSSQSRGHLVLALLRFSAKTLFPAVSEKAYTGNTPLDRGLVPVRSQPRTPQGGSSNLPRGAPPRYRVRSWVFVVGPLVTPQGGFLLTRGLICACAAWGRWIASIPCLTRSWRSALGARSTTATWCLSALLKALNKIGPRIERGGRTVRGGGLYF